MTDRAPISDAAAAGRSAPATAAELDAKRAIADGQVADFGGLTIRAGWVRELVIRAEDGGAVWIRNATLDGLLNLRDARRRSGGAANALILEGCTLPGNPESPASAPAIDASHAHFERLSLHNCEVSGVELSGAVISGALELDEIHGRDDGACWVKARGIRVGQSLSARRAKLSLPWAPETTWPTSESNWQNVDPYALDLAGAEIGGSLMLSPGFEARGGVNVAGATVGEGLRAAGAQLHAADVGTSRDALFAQYVRIHGPVFLCQNDDGTRFRAQGSLNFYGAEIDGAVLLTNAEVTPSNVTAGRSALYMPSASVAGEVILYPSKLWTVDLTNGTFGGKLDIWGPDTDPIERVVATTSRVRGDLILGGTISNADFSGATIDGRVALGEPDWPLKLLGVNNVASICLADARVGRHLSVSPIQTPAGYRVNADWTRKPFRIKSRKLACYPGSGWHVAVALYADTSGEGLALLDFLHRLGDGGALEVVVLDGHSSRIHDLAESLDIDTEERAEEFLSFFCANVWGPEGPFVIKPDTVKLVPRSGPGSWLARATLEYGTARFEAEFEIEQDGQVTMVEDRPLELLPTAILEQRLYAQPVRWFSKPDPGPNPPDTPDWPADPVLQPVSAWPELDKEREGDLLNELSAVLQKEHVEVLATDQFPPAWPRPAIDLGGLKVASLDDSDGRNWFEPGEVRPRVGILEQLLVMLLRHQPRDEVQPVRPKLGLQLVGFEYERIHEDPERDKVRQSVPPTTARPVRELIAAPLPPNRGFGAAVTAARQVVLRTRRAIDRTLDRLGEPGSNGNPAEEHSTDRFHARRTWLESQYATYPPAREHYQPEPYVQLARALRAAGNIEDANRVMYEKIRLVGKLRPNHRWPAWQRGLYRALRLPFLALMWTIGSAVVKPLRMLAIFACVWVIGVAALYAFPKALKVEASAVSTVLATKGGVVVQKNDVPTNRQAKEIVCGNNVNKVIYPVDVMIPFVDLRQESRCDFAANQQGWAVAKGLYALAGWILTAGVILAASGLVRRQFEF